MLGNIIGEYYLLTDGLMPSLDVCGENLGLEFRLVVTITVSLSVTLSY